MGVSPSTLKGYKWALGRFVKQVGRDYANANSREIQGFLNTIPPNHYGYGYRHTYYRAIKTFYRWLNLEFDLPNPIVKIRAPILGKPILPSLTREQVLFLIDKTDCVRNKAIIALFTESGLRLFELSNIKPADIFWDQRIIQVLGKGRKEAFAPFGELSERYLKEWLSQCESSEENIWGIYQKGIRTMLARLERETGLTCNPHTFRRTFACLLRKAGVDTLTIKELGRWESLEMVQRYTRSFTFQDSLRFYKAPLG
jgi:site-specific recombinase XerD